MAILGYSTQPTTNTTQFLFSDGMATKFTSVEGGTITAGHAWINNTTGGDNPANTLRFGIFTHDSVNNKPNILLSNTDNALIIPNGISTVDFLATAEFAGALDFTTGATLWFAVWPDNPSSSRGMSDAGSTNQSAELSQATSWPTWDIPMPNPGAYQSNQLGLWVDYTPAATGPNITKRTGVLKASITKITGTPFSSITKITGIS